MTFQGREGYKVTLISVYKICKGSIGPFKTTTALTQQWTILNNAAENTESIQSLTVTRLISFIKELNGRKHKVIIGIDVNEPFVSSKGYATMLYSECNLIDPIDTHNGTKNEPNTYIFG